MPTTIWGTGGSTMFWVPLLLVAWVLIDLLVVGTVVLYQRRRRVAAGALHDGGLRPGGPSRLAR